jgi:hypothetical protein
MSLPQPCEKVDRGPARRLASTRTFNRRAHKLALACVAITALAIVACIPAPASAHFYQSWQTYGGSSCSGNPVDPLNTLYFGPGSTNDPASVLTTEVGWQAQHGTAQYFVTHGTCRKMGDQRSRGEKRKHHTRLFSMTDRTSRGNYAVFGDAHQERKKVCGFAKVGLVFVPIVKDAVYKEINGVSGFDDGVREVIHRLDDYGNVRHGYHRGPNSRRFKQCTGDLVKWNGRQQVIEIPHG